MTEGLWLLLIAAVVGGACYYAGWQACRSYLLASLAVKKVTEEAALQKADFALVLDRNGAAITSLQQAVDKLAAVVGGKLENVDTSLLALFQALERTGFVRERRTPGRQVGEPETPPV